MLSDNWYNNFSELNKSMFNFYYTEIVSMVYNIAKHKLQKANKYPMLFTFRNPYFISL